MNNSEELTVEEAAERLAVKTQHIYGMIHRGSLSWLRPPRRGKAGEGGTISAESVERLRQNRIAFYRQKLMALGAD